MPGSEPPGERPPVGCGPQSPRPTDRDPCGQCTWSPRTQCLLHPSLAFHTFHFYFTLWCLMRIEALLSTQGTHLDSKSRHFLSGEQSAPWMRSRATRPPVMGVLLTTLPTTELTFPEINLLEAGQGVLGSFQGGQTCKEDVYLYELECSIVLAPTRDSPWPQLLHHPDTEDPPEPDTVSRTRCIPKSSWSSLPAASTKSKLTRV